MNTRLYSACALTLFLLDGVLAPCGDDLSRSVVLRPDTVGRQ